MSHFGAAKRRGIGGSTSSASAAFDVPKRSSSGTCRARRVLIGGGDTAFAVPVDTSASPIMQSVAATGETSLRKRTASDGALSPSLFSWVGGGLNGVASFLIRSGQRASVRQRAYHHFESEQRGMATAFGVGHPRIHARSQLLATSTSQPAAPRDPVDHDPNVVGTVSARSFRGLICCSAPPSTRVRIISWALSETPPSATIRSFSVC